MNATAAVTAERPTLLVDALRLDAFATGATGVLLAAGAPWLDGVLGTPAAFLAPLGALFVAYAAALWLLARSGAESATAVAAVIGGNVVWVALSVVAVIVDWLTLTALGTAFVLLQAAAVAVIAELQLVGLRRAS